MTAIGVVTVLATVAVRYDAPRHSWFYTANRIWSLDAGLAALDIVVVVVVVKLVRPEFLRDERIQAAAAVLSVLVAVAAVAWQQGPSAAAATEGCRNTQNVGTKGLAAVASAEPATVYGGPGRDFPTEAILAHGCTFGFDGLCVGEFTPAADFPATLQDSRWLRLSRPEGYVSAALTRIENYRQGMDPASDCGYKPPAPSRPTFDIDHSYKVDGFAGTTTSTYAPNDGPNETCPAYTDRANAASGGETLPIGSVVNVYDPTDAAASSECVAADYGVALIKEDQNPVGGTNAETYTYLPLGLRDGYGSEAETDKIYQHQQLSDDKLRVGGQRTNIYLMAVDCFAPFAPSDLYNLVRLATDGHGHVLVSVPTGAPISVPRAEITACEPTSDNTIPSNTTYEKAKEGASPVTFGMASASPSTPATP